MRHEWNRKRNHLWLHKWVCWVFYRFILTVHNLPFRCISSHISFFFYVPAFVWLYHTVKPYYWNHWRSEVNNNDNLTAMQCAVQNPLIAKALPKPQGVDLTSKIPLIQIRSSICGMCWNKGDQWRPHLATHKIKRIWPCPLCARLHRTLPEILFP